jgi:hypothetical protein
VQPQYYYLVSSLVDISLDLNKLPMGMDEFINFCSEEMSKKDFNDLKKLFIFNDIQNSIKYKDNNYVFVKPSYYNEEDFKENLKDTDAFFEFLSEYFYNKKNEKRVFPDLLEIDEVFQLFYLYIDSFCSDFLNDYFLFELNLRNITTGLSQRSNNLPVPNKIISKEDISELIKKSTSQDFGLSKSIDYIEELVEIYKSNDLIKIEKKIDEIRWEWLDERIGYNYFSADFIYTYAIKLASLKRWVNLNIQNGEERLNNLINQISLNIKLPEQFLRRK